MTLTNWAGNVTFTPAAFHRPTTVAQVQEVVSGARQVRVLGSGHSFSPIAATEGDLISLAQLQGDPELDSSAGLVCVPGGMRYGELAAWLQARGFALANMASLPHIGVVGGCATGTHGSGVGNGSLSSVVQALELVVADGTVVSVERGVEDDLLRAAVVGLGLFGVVTSITLAVRPTFLVAQHVYQAMPLDQALEHLMDVLGAAYSVSLFTNWGTTAGSEPVFGQVWVKHTVSQDGTQPQGEGTVAAADPVWLGAKLATGPCHPVPGFSGAVCTEQLGVWGPWNERLPHFRMEFTPSAGEELQTEYLVPMSSGVDALRAIAALSELIAPLLQISEIRTIAADDLWLSPSGERTSMAIHFTWNPDADAVAAGLLRIEAALEPYCARPHWGKVFTMGPGRLHQVYPRLGDAVALAVSRDPGGVFRSDWTEKTLGTCSGALSATGR